MYLDFGIHVGVPVPYRNLCVKCFRFISGTASTPVVCCLACFAVGMQHASLSQVPRHLTAGSAGLPRAHTRFCPLRPGATLDVRVPQATPQPKVEECKTYLGSVSPLYAQKEPGCLTGANLRCICCREKFWQIQPFRDGQQADYRDPDSKNVPPKICLKNLNHVALEAADPVGLTHFYTRVLGFKSVNRPDLPFEGSWLEGAGLLVHIIAEDPSVPKKIRNWKVSLPFSQCTS